MSGVRKLRSFAPEELPPPANLWEVLVRGRKDTFPVHTALWLFKKAQGGIVPVHPYPRRGRLFLRGNLHDTSMVWSLMNQMEEIMEKSKRKNASCMLVISLLVLTSLPALAQGSPATASAAGSGTKVEAPLSNNDVIEMVKLGLGDEVVTAKIKEAKAVAFNTDVDNLAKLKADGVSSAVITAMLQKNTVPVPSPQAQTSQEKLADKELGLFGPSGVVLCSANENDKLTSIGGSISSTYAFVTVLMFADFPGRHASVRVKDPRPSILLHSENSPEGRYFFVKAKSNEKDETRSVKMGRMHMFNFKSITAPDKDWVVKTTLKEEQHGVWRLSPVRDLAPGEYGLFELGLPQLEMYDFGIDR